ncbi:hypothetical protein L6164_025284 [Bauhinia variegata]|uniref:Uncharacterized protein n=1 Tax=Bauhinia variegata TaxID=167791 RepID=A0ACB9M0Y4_BAUVA|nr:hypothetical protein L6164_025284 [Bauhinia variegata]
MAYAYTNYTYGTGCVIWTEVTSFTNETDENAAVREIFIYRNPHFETGVERLIKRTMLIREIGGRTVVSILYDIAAEDKNENEIEIFCFRSIVAATNKFSMANKLGEGGFGSVYMAWQLWREDKAIEIIDPSLLECCLSHEAPRCVQVGLLCVQERASDRPNMSEVVSMLSNETASLPSPKRPAFYIDVEESEPNEKPKTCSINEVTISIIDAR